MMAPHRSLPPLSTRARRALQAGRDSALHLVRRHWRRRMRFRFPRDAAPDARYRFVMRGVPLEVPRAVLTPEIWRYLCEGRYETEELDAIVSATRPGDRVLELGAGIGFISSFVAQRLGVERVVAVEANPKLIEVARRNHAINNVPVELVNAVVAQENGTVPFYMHADFWRCSMTPQPDTEEVRLPARALRDLLAEVRPSLLIVDIEGGELTVFDGIDLSGVREAILEVHPDVIGLDGIGRVFARFAEEGLFYHPRKSSRAVVVLARP